MRYTEFRDAIRDELRRSPSGRTWPEIRDKLKLPYKSPCQEWVGRLEHDIGLSRTKGSSRALVWKIDSGGRSKI
ncbi:MAG: hypothetical protein ABIC40_03040 [bacterium]